MSERKTRGEFREVLTQLAEENAPGKAPIESVIVGQWFEDMEDSHIEQLLHLVGRELVSLDIRGFCTVCGHLQHITNEVLRMVVRFCPKLERLRVHGAPRITPGGIENLLQLRKPPLRDIEVNGARPVGGHPTDVLLITASDVYEVQFVR